MQGKMFKPTYEELKMSSYAERQAINFRLSLPMRNWKIVTVRIIWNLERFKPTYEELKFMLNSSF